MSLKKIFLTFFTTFSLFPILAKFANAAPIDLQQYYLPGKAVGGNTATLSTYGNLIIKNAPIVAGVSAFITAFFAGFRLITAAGNEKEVKNASLMLTYSLIGLGLSILAFWFTRILFAVLGGSGLF